ncbi:DUF3696 domain-containing protein [Brachybacterium sp. SW0106-09]|uniref:AAA family ATPase n=1 Tax=Brachybacterium sp. SW0106-09 TaxID=1704590 RepID=UPI0011E04765|nr:DUF3696 domain-containing protein [Brachybacterium sp. SW0106-09]
MEATLVEQLAVKWQGFRNFHMRESLTFKPLTFLIGKNNVGKSSLYAPLLVMKQTLSASNPDTALLSRGSLIDVGIFQDYIGGHDVERDLTLEISFGASAVQTKRNPPSRISTTFRSPDGIQAKVVSQSIYGADGTRTVRRKREVESSTFEIFESPLLPKNTPGRPRQEVAALKKSMREEQPQGFLFSGTGALELPQRYMDNEESWKRVRNWYASARQLYSFQQHTVAHVSRALNGIKYIGPLRKSAQRTYRLGAESPSGVGTEGEYAPELIFRARDSDTHNALNEWLSLLGYGELAFEAIGDDYFQMSLMTPGKGYRVNVAHTGTGVSQILPILTQGVTSTSGQTLVFQQPELHLNPAQQTIVADFMIQQVEDQKRVVVESHSEHMLLRLRRRIAEGAISSNDVAVYYVESSRDVGTIVREVPIDDIGNIEHSAWPAGFFEESLDDAFAMSIAQSRGKGGPR